MRKVFCALAGIAAGLAVQAGPAAAQQAGNYPWCVETVDAGMDCSFTSMQQCNDYLWGIGGMCERNPALQAPPPAGTDRALRRRQANQAASS